MGQLIIPADREIKGPWFIDINSLEHLSEILIKIENKLEESYNVLVKQAAELEVEDYKRRNREITLDETILKVKETHYPFKENYKFAIITNKRGDKIKDNDLVQLLKDPQIEQFAPVKLEIQLRKGACEFTLDINEDLNIRIKIPDNVIFSDINYEINKWIEKYKPNIAIEKWSSWFPHGLGIGIILLALSSTFLIKSNSDIYKLNLKRESHELLKDSLDDREIRKAIQILLENASDYVPVNYNSSVTPDKNALTIYITVVTLLVIFFIRPKTVIGIGKNKKKLLFYKRWTYFVLVFVPLSILFPVIRSKLFS